MAVTKDWILGKENLRNYYGIKGLKFIWHNEWADPEVRITLFGHDFDVNEPSVSDAFWDDYIRDDKGKVLSWKEKDFKGFERYMQEHAAEVKETVINLIKPIATYFTCNWGGIAILAIEQGFDDYVISAEHYGDGYIRISKSQIRYNLNGDTWFLRRGRREKLSNYIRVGR